MVLGGPNWALFIVAGYWAMVDGRGDGQFSVLAASGLDRAAAAAWRAAFDGHADGLSVELVTDEATDVWLGRSLRHLVSDEGLGAVVDTVLSEARRF